MSDNYDVGGFVYITPLLHEIRKIEHSQTPPRSAASLVMT